MAENSNKPVEAEVVEGIDPGWWPGWVDPSWIPANANESTLVLEGPLSWNWDEIHIGEAELGVAMGRKWPKEPFGGKTAYRFIIERLGKCP